MKKSCIKMFNILLYKKTQIKVQFITIKILKTILHNTEKAVVEALHLYSASGITNLHTSLVGNLAVYFQGLKTALTL